MREKQTDKQNEFKVITKTRDLCDYVMTITQKSPKQFRFSYVGKLQNLALNSLEAVVRANDYPIGEKYGTRYLAHRFECQMQAITEVKLLAYFAEFEKADATVGGFFGKWKYHCRRGSTDSFRLSRSSRLRRHSKTI